MPECRNKLYNFKINEKYNEVKSVKITLKDTYKF